MKPKKKRAKPFNANAATEKRLTAEGWTCTRVEQRIPHCFITRDDFNIGDILCCSPTRGIMLVQATGGGHGPNRAAKVRQEPRHAIWLASGGRIQVWDWRKRAGQKDRVCMILEIQKIWHINIKS
jgi:hypothetical protein